VFCSKCGNPVKEGTKFCAKCGTPVAAPVQKTVVEEIKTPVKETVNTIEEAVAEEQSVTNVIPTVETASIPVQEVVKKPKKKEKKSSGSKKAIFVIGGILVAFILIVAICIANAASVSNFFMKTFSSTEKYYHFVEEKTAKEIAQVAGCFYEKAILEGLDISNKGASVELKVSLDEGGKDLIELAGLAGVDLSWIDEAQIAANASVKDLSYGFGTTIGLNDVDIISGNMIMDMEEGSGYVQIPELSKTYIGIDFEEDMDEYDAEAMQEMQENMQKLQEACAEFLETCPDRAKFEKIISKYMNIVITSAEDVSKDDATIKVEGVKQKCTALIVTIDEEAFVDMLKAVVKEMKKDEDLEELVTNFASSGLLYVRGKKEVAAIPYLGYEENEKYIEENTIDDDEVYDAFIDELEDELSNMENHADGDNEFVITVYVNNKGEIVGREIEYDDDYYNMCVSMLMPKKGNQVAYEYTYEENGRKVSFIGSGKESGNKVTGDFSVEYNGAALVDFKVKDFNTEDLKKLQVNGEVEISMGSGISKVIGMTEYDAAFDGSSVNLKAKSSDNSAELTVGAVYDEESLGTVTMAYKTEKSSSLKIPNDKDVVYADDEDDVEDWLEDVDWDNLIEKMEKADVSSGIIDELEDFIDMLDY